MQRKDKCSRGKNKEEISGRCLCACVRERYFSYIGSGEQHGALKCSNPCTNRQTAIELCRSKTEKFVCRPIRSNNSVRGACRFFSCSRIIIRLLLIE
ncbi:hypothetical protein HNY73_023004 [Argiope bruennichi]|uniref:Uncharacterized protein n=1 Tax=Argiope bruennichi TaxID=94029 RepID=A0A8T0E2R2_ARGBR|nr:hypothetical protein HNY73_023004 [Argiope bruennichi]